MTVCYMHFYIEHLIGHHVNVCTPRDPATARLGESFYAFYPRTVIGSVRSAWKIEQGRLNQAGHAKWSGHNQMLWFIALPIPIIFFSSCNATLTITFIRCGVTKLCAQNTRKNAKSFLVYFVCLAGHTR